ncbi:GntR family transcriptional regulator [Stagnihabitans tardus]|uniref:FCD domain-containing protein n=1 Tax=Stagnihabitans tardus TaxID=2699202 RepID=A0AAE4YDC8_9RHOB|nr:GntR family transcriptional regulator [Stagnihabitans tardus]NBZ89381.1 FCD domain-containing protein [Stagnihabitans tardus]
MSHPKGLLRRSAYDAIKTLIITGQLTPGARVTEIELTEQLGVSRTPVREALNRLERDGLLVSRSKTGFAVNSFDLGSAEEVFDLREMLEPRSSALAACRVSDADREALQAILATCDAINPDHRTVEQSLMEMTVGIDVHRVIARMSGNALLAEMLDGILDRCQIYIWMDLSLQNSWAEARAEHADLVDAICSGDAERAEALSLQHIRGARKNVVKVLKARENLRGAARGLAPTR